MDMDFVACVDLQIAGNICSIEKNESKINLKEKPYLLLGRLSFVITDNTCNTI